jgi:hypothetical protein
VIEFARALVAESPRDDHVARLTMVFSFVAHLVDAPADVAGPRDGVDLLLALAGEHEGPAVILAAMLQAIGERASVDYVPGGMPFVRVELQPDDRALLPPYAGVWMRRGRYFLPLDARAARRPFGFVPLPVRRALGGAITSRQGDGYDVNRAQ